MRFLILSAMATLVSACSENPLQPNTDIGLRVWDTVSPSSVSVRDNTTDSLRIRVYVANPTDGQSMESTCCRWRNGSQTDLRQASIPSAPGSLRERERASGSRWIP